MQQQAKTYDKTLHCALCKQSFTSKKVRQKYIAVDSITSDWCITYTDEEASPDRYFAFVCPYCGYAFTEKFQPKMSADVQKLLWNSITKHWVPQQFGDDRTIEMAIRALMLAAYCGSVKGEINANLAGIYLRIAWFYRKTDRLEKEQRFLRLARCTYEQSYETADYEQSELTEDRVLYMIAELHARTGDVDTALNCFAKLLKKTTIRGTDIETRARTRYQELRSEKNER
ncbi:MAG: DUF2225 domain-containing protein [Bacilli bacterium]